MLRLDNCFQNKSRSADLIALNTDWIPKRLVPAVAWKLAKLVV